MTENSNITLLCTIGAAAKGKKDAAPPPPTAEEVLAAQFPRDWDCSVATLTALLAAVADPAAAAPLQQQLAAALQAAAVPPTRSSLHRRAVANILQVRPLPLFTPPLKNFAASCCMCQLTSTLLFGKEIAEVCQETVPDPPFPELV